MKILRDLGPKWYWILLALAVLLVLPLLFPAYWVTLVTQMFIFGMLAMSLDILPGYTGLLAVDDVSFSVEHGARRVIIGPNGAGKTTLFNLISGALDPTGGRITYRGTDITHMAVHRRTALGITRTFQITNLFPNLTVLRNLVIDCLALEMSKGTIVYSSSPQELWENQEVKYQYLGV